MRETLFNWLQPMLPGARVLDLFAGSGALGLEALSRGAAAAVLVERDPKLAAALRATAARLQGGEAARSCRPTRWPGCMRSRTAAFDLAFVDPPFDAEPVGRRAAGAGAEAGARDAWLYVEAPHDADAVAAAGMGAASRRPHPRRALRAVPAATAAGGRCYTGHDYDSATPTCHPPNERIANDRGP